MRRLSRYALALGRQSLAGPASLSSGKKVPPQIQRIRSDDLLASVFPDVAACQENIEGDIQIPDHPLVQEVMKDVLTEAMDLEGLRELLSGIRERPHSLHRR